MFALRSKHVLNLCNILIKQWIVKNVLLMIFQNWKFGKKYQVMSLVMKRLEIRSHFKIHLILLVVMFLRVYLMGQDKELKDERYSLSAFIFHLFEHF